MYFVACNVSSYLIYKIKSVDISNYNNNNKYYNKL
jgi:hypothetical protein